MNLPDKDILADFNIGQKRMLICQEWEQLRGEFLNDAKTLLGVYILSSFLVYATDGQISDFPWCTTASVEMLLLLLWRHILFYAEGRHINNPSVKTSTAGVVRYLSAVSDEDEFRMDAARKLAPVIQRVGALDLVRVFLSESFSISCILI